MLKAAALAATFLLFVLQSSAVALPDAWAPQFLQPDHCTVWQAGDTVAIHWNTRGHTEITEAQSGHPVAHLGNDDEADETGLITGEYFAHTFSRVLVLNKAV